MTFVRWCYNGLLRIAVSFVLLRYFWRSFRNKAYRQHFAERFGYVTRQSAEKVIWVHAVSVGETIGIRPLVEALLKDYPEYKIWLTNGTINGRARTKAFFDKRVLNSYAPYDLPGVTRRFVRRIQPVLALIMETEVWPNWLDILHKNNIPVILVNARLSEKSYRAYKRYQCLFHSVWPKFSMIAAQATADANRYKLLGVPDDHLCVTSNLKYHLILPETLSEQVHTWRQQLPNEPIWIAASVHLGEVPELIETFSALKKVHPKLLWFLVPRHPEQAEAIQKLCVAKEWSVLSRSQLGKVPLHPIEVDILLVDTIGELFLFYSLAQVAFVGGSFIAHGGHNILEPAAVGAVITCGPSMYNFSAILAQFQEADALLQCDDGKHLAVQTLALFSDTALRDQYIKAAKACFAEHKKVLTIYLSIIKRFL